mmetsp:Transcript_11651/g.24382  ORF Transcript_11651/g.24382 Transcript_11651/m.24382 type:complete len:208 (+) Transcript_11651:2590-3213(+)
MEKTCQKNSAPLNPIGLLEKSHWYNVGLCNIPSAIALQLPGPRPVSLRSKYLMMRLVRIISESMITARRSFWWVSAGLFCRRLRLRLTVLMVVLVIRISHSAAMPEVSKTPSPLWLSPQIELSITLIEWIVRLSRSAFASSTMEAGQMLQLPRRIALKNNALTQMLPTAILLAGWGFSCTTCVGHLIFLGHFQMPCWSSWPVPMHSQ